MADTKIRSIRIPESLWRRARARARREGTDVSTLVRDFLAAYIQSPSSKVIQRAEVILTNQDSTTMRIPPR